MKIDSFPFSGSEPELLLLDCRLTELYDVVDAFVIVEATVDHQGHPKPLNYLEHQDRYKQWADKITFVVAETLPTVAENDWEWAREHAQREYIGQGLYELDVEADDILIQSDLDEIPTALAMRNVRPQRNQMVSFHQRGHFWAVDWEYPPGWNGPVACRVGALKEIGAGPRCGPFTAMRDARNSCPHTIPVGGWHFSWLGGTEEQWLKKVNSFCHKQEEPKIRENAARFFRDGIHVDGIMLKPVDVDRTWPKWMQNPANVPDTWLRPR